MALHDNVALLRDERIAATGQATPDFFHGVGKEKIRLVLTQLHLGDNADLVDGVFALLDDETESWFARPPAGACFCHGATTAHLACHIGILQRGGGKLDREGRDYWIKPLRDLGGIEPVTLHEGEFLSGHVKAKSPNSSYRLNTDLIAVLQAPDDAWQDLLAAWVSDDAARERRAFQAEMAAEARKRVDTGHSDLIRASVDHYVPRFLPGYAVVYIDDGDGDRITDDDRQRLAAAGIELTLEDGMPDVLLWNESSDELWVIEAVTSDGEVDIHKVNQLLRLAERSGKSGVGFTTTYRTWKEAASRQGSHQNIAVDTFIWIEADPAKQLHVQSFN
ncbi:BsuBI/PstI family type II restriction endonuclease [Pseudomonadota bacterium]